MPCLRHLSSDRRSIAHAHACMHAVLCGRDSPIGVGVANLVLTFKLHLGIKHMVSCFRNKCMRLKNRAYRLYTLNLLLAKPTSCPSLLQ